MCWRRRAYPSRPPMREPGSMFLLARSVCAKLTTRLARWAPGLQVGCLSRAGHRAATESTGLFPDLGGNGGSGSRSRRSPLGGIWRASQRERRGGGGKGSYGRIEGQDGAPWPDGDGGRGWVKAGVKTGRSKSETRFAAPEPFSDDRVGVIAQGGGPYVHLRHVDFNFHNHDIIGHLFLRCHHHDGAKVRNAGVGTRPAESADHASRCQC
jgi:hypothetical protein